MTTTQGTPEAPRPLALLLDDMKKVAGYVNRGTSWDELIAASARINRDLDAGAGARLLALAETGLAAQAFFEAVPGGRFATIRYFAAAAPDTWRYATTIEGALGQPAISGGGVTLQEAVAAALEPRP